MGRVFIKDASKHRRIMSGAQQYPYSTKNRKIEKKFHRKQPPSQIHRKGAAKPPVRCRRPPALLELLLYKDHTGACPHFSKTATQHRDPYTAATLQPPPRALPGHVHIQTARSHHSSDTHTNWLSALLLPGRVSKLLQPNVGQTVKQGEGTSAPSGKLRYKGKMANQSE